MNRELLTQTIEEVQEAIEAADSSETQERLEALADRLRYQAEEKQSTPALGTLDRIQHSFEEIVDQTGDEEVAKPLNRAREHIFSFLGTLDDRGMTQHGWTPKTEETN